MNILFYEDSTTFNTYVTKELTKEEYNVFDMLTKVKAEKWLENNTPDIAILDIVEEDRFSKAKNNRAGFEIAELVKKKNKDIPIVFLTGYAKEPKILEEAKIYGPVEVFDKGKENPKELNRSVSYTHLTLPTILLV